MSTKTSDVEFTCPRCGGHWYRSSPIRPHDPAIVGNLQGECRGTWSDSNVKPCDFTWDRAEDWRFFAVVTRETFDTEEAFKRAYHALD